MPQISDFASLVEVAVFLNFSYSVIGDIRNYTLYRATKKIEKAKSLLWGQSEDQPTLWVDPPSTKEGPAPDNSGALDPTAVLQSMENLRSELSVQQIKVQKLGIWISCIATAICISALFYCGLHPVQTISVLYASVLLVLAFSPTPLLFLVSLLKGHKCLTKMDGQVDVLRNYPCKLKAFRNDTLGEIEQAFKPTEESASSEEVGGVVESDERREATEEEVNGGKRRKKTLRGEASKN